MRYIVSDIHGCYKEYKALLEAIAFSDEDDVMTYHHWIRDGGKVTAEQFKVLSNSEKKDILYYLQEAREDKKPLVYQGNGHLALDCGCVFGGRLAAYCVETGGVTYVEGAE